MNILSQPAGQGTFTLPSKNTEHSDSLFTPALQDKRRGTHLVTGRRNPKNTVLQSSKMAARTDAAVRLCPDSAVFSYFSNFSFDFSLCFPMDKHNYSRNISYLFYLI